MKGLDGSRISSRVDATPDRLTFLILIGLREAAADDVSDLVSDDLNDGLPTHAGGTNQVPVRVSTVALGRSVGRWVS